MRTSQQQLGKGVSLVNTHNVKTARPWQRECVEALANARFSMNQSPGGSGKSLTQCMLGALDINATGNKQLILVPQNHIHHGYCGEHEIVFRLTDGGAVQTWRVGHNFCREKHAKLARLREWLLRDPDDLVGPNKVAIASHKAMVQVWATLTPEQKAKAIRRTTFRIDEAHHIKGVFYDADGVDNPDEFTNGLGQLVRYVIVSDRPDSKLHLTTATAFRGDRQAILSESVWDHFQVFRLGWDEYYEMLGLDGCEIDFVPFDTDPLGHVVQSIQAEPRNRHLVVLPPLGSSFWTEATLPTLLKSLYRTYSPDDVLDLVTPRTQEVNKRRLLVEPDSLHVVVACRLFDEGTDWPICDRMYNTDACERSMTLAVQRFFRPFRYHPAKRKVKINNYVPAFCDDLPEEDKRRCLSDRFTGTLACIVTNGELLPVKVPLPHKEGEGPGKQRSRSLQEIYGHQTYLEIVETLLNGYEALRDKSDTVAAKKLVQGTLKDFGVPANVDPSDLETAMQELLVRVASPKARRIGKDEFGSERFAGAIVRLGFDKVWPKTGGRTNLVYGTENVSVHTVRELLNLIHRPLSKEQIDDGIRKYFTRTGKRPTFKTGWIDELETTSSAVEKQLRRNFNTTLAREVDFVLGNGIEGLLGQCHSLIQMYAKRGIRLGTKYGNIPEMGMSSSALNARLRTHFGTTLGAEAEKMLGPFAAPLDLEDVKRVLREYRKRGIRIRRKFGMIPELKMTSYNLSDRLLRTYGVRLAEIVAGSM